MNHTIHYNKPNPFYYERFIYQIFDKQFSFINGVDNQIFFLNDKESEFISGLLRKQGLTLKPFVLPDRQSITDSSSPPERDTDIDQSYEESDEEEGISISFNKFNLLKKTI